MKKLFLIFAMALLLTGCGKDKRIYGEVISVTNEGQHVQLTVRTQEDQDRHILADSNTFVYSFAGIEDGLLSGKLIKPYITAYDLRRMNGAFLAERICVESIQLPEGYELEDGTVLNIRKDYLGTSYEAPNGTEILWDQEPIGPHNVSVGSLPTFDMLNEQAQEAILAYYEEQGLLYDLDAELEKAYQAFLSMGNPAEFQSHHLSQDISPTAANEKLIWYGVYVTRPVGDGLHHQSSTHTVFDRETGEVVNTAELFQCTEKELGRRILEIVNMPDTELSREMENAFRFEYLNFSSNYLDVCFPAGSLISQNTSHILGVEYEDLAGFIHPWAIPDSIE